MRRCTIPDPALSHRCCGHFSFDTQFQIPYTLSQKKEVLITSPYTCFAGRVGNSFITTIRDKKKILGVKCNNCDKVFVLPRQTCEKCFEEISGNWVELKNTGEEVNLTVVRYDDRHLPRKAPFILAMIKLDGADTPMVHIIEGIEADKVQKGLRVQGVFAEEATNTILNIDHFKPVK